MAEWTGKGNKSLRKFLVKNNEDASKIMKDESGKSGAEGMEKDAMDTEGVPDSPMVQMRGKKFKAPKGDSGGYC